MSTQTARARAEQLLEKLTQIDGRWGNATRERESIDAILSYGEEIRREERERREWLEEGEKPLVLLSQDDEGDIIARDLQREGCIVHGETFGIALTRLQDAREAWDKLAEPPTSLGSPYGDHEALESLLRKALSVLRAIQQEREKTR